MDCSQLEATAGSLQLLDEIQWQAFKQVNETGARVVHEK